MAQDQDWQYEDEEEDDTVQLVEESEEEGRWPTIVSHAMRHPRLTLGGGSLLLSFAVDVAIRFDPFAVVIGLATAVAIGWNGDALARGMSFLIPGLDQEQVQEDADRFAATLVEDAPVYADQRVGAKLRRLFGGGEGEVVTPPKREGAQNPQTKDEGGITLERIATWLEEGRINDKQFFFLLQRIDNPITRSARSVGAQSPSGADVSPKNQVVTPVTLPPGWTPEDAALIPGFYRVFGNLDKCLEAIDVSTHPRNRDFAREILKQQGLWKEK